MTSTPHDNIDDDDKIFMPPRYARQFAKAAPPADAADAPPPADAADGADAAVAPPPLDGGYADADDDDKIVMPPRYARQFAKAAPPADAAAADAVAAPPADAVVADAAATNAAKPAAAQRKRRQLLSRLMLPICVAVFIFAGVNLILTLREYAAGEAVYEAARENVQVIETEPSAESEQQPEQPEHDYPQLLIDFDSLRAVNTDVVGWLYIEDTQINYPLLIGEDNDQYLHHTYDMTYNSSGSIFMDYRCSATLEGQNDVIYGHNMKNGSMFGELGRYASQDYADAHPYFYIYTPDTVYVYQIFSAFVTTTSGKVYTFAFADDEQQRQFIELMKNASQIVSEFTPAVGDHIVTLSTCTTRTVDERFVVLGARLGAYPL
ncbi:MAG: class B sortase [Bacillota bacterium]|nr:class B sortase [Bacillota bacterium]